jgi:methionine-gamma-lyase
MGCDMRSDTVGVHGGREQLGEAHVPPIDLSTTYKTPDLSAATRSIDAMAQGEGPRGSFIYQRLHNPTVARFEAAVCALEGGARGVSYSSGMAAVTAALLAAKMVGSHVVAVRPVYGGTDHLLSSELLGLKVTWATTETVGSCIQDDTALVLCETPANPTVQLVDIARIVREARGVPVLVDSTFATPVLQRPLEHGATLVLHSGTKFLGGHGDVMGGIVVCDESWARRLRQVRVLTGATLHPMAAYTLHRGLQTLAIRVRAAQASAQKLVQRLVSHPLVERVRYPGLVECDLHGLVGTQMDGPGSLIAMDVRGGYDAALRVMSAVRLLTPAVSLGSCDSLIQHPAGLTHRIVSNDALEAGGIGPGLLRISVGLEDVDDLWDDLSAALDASRFQLVLSAK